MRYAEPANPGPPITGYSVQYRRTDTDPVGAWSSSGCSLLRNKEDTFGCTGLVAGGEYDFQVRASNSDGTGAWSDSAQTDNDPPTFDSGLSGKSWSVPENSGPGVNVGDPITATDPDGGAVSYYLEKYHAFGLIPPLAIGTSTGQLTTKTHDFNHESEPLFDPFYVVAKDPAGGTARFAVTVFVSDVDEPPTSVPGSLAVKALPGGRFEVTWTAAADEAKKPPIKGYDIRYRTPYGSGSWDTHRSTELVTTHEGNVPATDTTITGLTADSEYEVQIAARNGEGVGGADSWSDSVRVTAIGNKVPEFGDGPSTTRSVAENTPAGRNVGAAVSATDSDGGKLTYTLEGTDADSFDIRGNDGQILTREGVRYDHEENNGAKKEFEVTVRVSDGQGGEATIDVTISITDVAEDLAAPAPPTLSSDTGSSLNASWEEPEDTGGADVTGYKVQFRNASVNGGWRSQAHSGVGRSTTISGLEDETTYEVRVKAVHGSGESPWSEAASIDLGEITSRITFTETSPIARTIAENTGADIELGDSVKAAIEDYPPRFVSFSLEGDDASSFKLANRPIVSCAADPDQGCAQTQLVTTDDGYDYEEKADRAVTILAKAGVIEARMVVNITITDDDTEAPSAPAAPAVASSSTTELSVTWVEPENAGPEITDYNLQYREQGAGASWTPLNSPGTGLATTISGLTEGTTYEVQVQAVNAEGTGAWSGSGTGVPRDPIPNELPVFVESPPVTRQVPENSGADLAVGAPVTATDEGTSIEYGLEGADGGAFTIDSATGQIRTTGAGYDHEARSSYAVTVTATDDRDGVSRLDVTIEVEDLPEAPDAPGTPSVGAASPVSLDVTWTAPADNAGRRPITGYEVQYRTPPATGEWQDWPHAGTALTAAITELDSGTTYEVQVRAINDDGPGDVALPGAWSAGTGGTSPNQAPSFTEGTSASRALAENPEVGVAIGAALAATDPENHPVSYSLEGDDGDSFSIDGGGVLRTISTEVYNFEAKPSYSFVAVATDEFGAQGRIAVTVALEDVAESLAAADASASESAGTLVFTVTRLGATGSPASVAWSTVDGTATAGRDYRAGSGTLRFAAGEAAKTIRVTLLDDETFEGEETFALTLRDPANEASVRVLGTIVDDDPEPGLSISGATADEGAGTVAFTVALSLATENHEVAVSWSTADETATAGRDYEAASGTLTFAPGDTERTVEVTLLDDALSEGDETFTVTLSDPVNATVARAAASGSIVDDDGEPEVSVAPATAGEGAGTMTFTVTLSPARENGEATVSWATSDGTATAGTDYEAASGTLTFAPGDTERTVEVTLLDDTLSEGDETFTVTLSDPVNATVAAGEATGTIADDDPEPGVPVDEDEPEVSVAAATAGEGAGTMAFPVTLTPARDDRAVTVSWSTSDGTATAGADYAAGSGIVTFAPGQTGSAIEVTLLDDTSNEGDETFTVTLSAAVNATVAQATASGTIVDDDPGPEVPVDEDEPEVSVAAVTAGEGAGTMAFTVTLSPARENGEATVSWSTSDGTATAGSDYVAGSGTLTFAPGEAEKTVEVTLLDDAADEGDETFTVTLSAPVNATVAQAAASGTIVDDDDEEDDVVRGEPGFSVAAATADEGARAIAFTVTLSPPRESREAAVSWSTSDGTATAGTDYVAASGFLTFAPGQTESVVVVLVLDDAVDEVDETFTVTLRNPINATVARAAASGTIVDDDEPTETGARIRREWLAQFVRSMSTEVVDMLSERLEDGTRGSGLTLGGHRVGIGGEPDLDAAPSEWLGGEAAVPDMERRPVSGAMTGRELLLGSSFHAATDRGPGGHGQLASWGRTSPMWFGSTDGVTGDGMTGLLGADLEHGPVLTGVALSYSEGAGSIGGLSFAGEVAGAHPYLRYALDEDVSLWSLLGHGSGELRWSEPAGDGRPMRSEIGFSLAALGGRASLATVRGLDIALESDAFAAWIGSGSDRGLPGAAAASRMRLLIEGSAALNRLATSFRAGLRHDGGDDVTGTGIELRSRLGYADPAAGVSASGDLHGFVRDGDYREWRAAGALGYDPGAPGRGLGLDASLSFGAASDAFDDPWSRTWRPDPVPPAPAGRARLALGYGFVERGTGALATPFMETHWSDRGALRLRGGVRLAGSGKAPGFRAELAAERVESESRAGRPEHRIGLTLRLPFGERAATRR